MIGAPPSANHVHILDVIDCACHNLLEFVSDVLQPCLFLTLALFIDYVISYGFYSYYIFCCWCGLGCQWPIREEDQCSWAAYPEPSLPINTLLFQHPLWTLQRRCRFRPWLPLQSPWRCTDCCFSWPLAKHPWLWCSYSACEASWEEH